MDTFQFLVTNIFMLSAGTVIYMAVRTLPRIEDELTTEKRGVFERWIASEIPERIDKAMNGFLFKSIKRTRVLLLRFDNTLGERLKKIKPDGNGNGKSKAQMDFSAITGDNGGVEVAKETGLLDNQ